MTLYDLRHIDASGHNVFTRGQIYHVNFGLFKVQENLIDLRWPIVRLLIFIIHVLSRKYLNLSQFPYEEFK